jgi:tetratricopeptide (TPR) repeat protein
VESSRTVSEALLRRDSITTGLIINNVTKNEEATLRKIQDVSTESGAIGRGTITREEINALQQGITRLLNLLETNQAQTLKAGTMQLSQSELSLKEIVLKGNECYEKGNFITAIEYYNQAIQRDPNSADAWANKGRALGTLGKYNEAIQFVDRALQIDPSQAYTWHLKMDSCWFRKG